MASFMDNLLKNMNWNEGVTFGFMCVISIVDVMLKF